MQTVILAAGESSRFWPLNRLHKALFKIKGKPLIAYLVEDIRKAGIKDIVIVQSPKKDIERELKDGSLKYVIQKEATGTGDALLAAEKLIKEEQFFLFNAYDSDAKDYIGSLSSKFKKGKSKLIILASKTKTPWLYGILKMKGNRVLEIIEKPGSGKEPSDLKSDNLFLFPRDFLPYLKKVPSHPFSLIYGLNLYAKEKPIEVAINRKKSLSLKLPWNVFPILDAKLKDLKTLKSNSVIIGKNVAISGKVFIDEGTKIGAGTVIEGPCYIGKGCEIGARNVLCGPVDLEEGVRTGAFMEIKHSIVQEGTHFHSGYLGDSLIGRNCRFGAGLVIANRRFDRKNIFSTVKGKKIDAGLTYFGAAIGQNTKIGINTGIMPGVLIGSNVIVGPGSVVFDNIPDNTLFYQEYKNIVKKRKVGNP